MLLGMGSVWDMGPSEEGRETVIAGPPVMSEHTPARRSHLVAVGRCVVLPHLSPSNMSTIRKKAREKEDFPLPVRPQIPIWKERSRGVVGTLALAPEVHRCGRSQQAFLSWFLTGFSL